jgi:glucokinase
LVVGRLWTGASGCAGVVGQVPLWERDLEAYASATAVARAAGARDAGEAARRATAGDAAAAAAFERAGTALGIVVAGLLNVLNPEAVCLGGGMAAAFDLLEGPLRREVDARAFRLARDSARIVPASLTPDSGLLGAARLCMAFSVGS